MVRPEQAQQAIQALNSGRADLAVLRGEPIAAALEAAALPRLSARSLEPVQPVARRRYDAAFHQSPLHMQLLSPDGLILDVNRTMLDERQLNREDVVNKFLWDGPSGAAVPENRTRLQWVVRQTSLGHPQRNEVNIPTPTGNRLLLTQMTPIRGPDGHVEFILVVGVDLTHNRRAHAELERQSHEFAAGYAISRSIVEATSAEVVLASVLEHLPLALDGADVAIELDGVRMGDSFQGAQEVRNQTSGHSVVVYVSGPPMCDSLRQLVTDVVRRVDQWMTHHDAREGLVRALEASEAATQAKAAFLTHMSHEIRTPLHALLGFAELLFGDEGLSRGQRESVEIIRDNGQRLLDLLENVLTLSRLEAGRVSSRVSQVDLVDLLADIVALFQPRVHERGISLGLHCDLSHLAVEVDASKLRQIVTNLVANALRHTTEGGVLVLVRRGQVQLEIEVSDTGPGVEPELRSCLFEPFQRGTGGATGLGLAISRQLALALDGELSLLHTGPRGTCFRLAIPFTPAEDGADVLSTLLGSPRVRAVAALRPLSLPQAQREALLQAAAHGDIAELERLTPGIADRAHRQTVTKLVQSYDLQGLVTLLTADT